MFRLAHFVSESTGREFIVILQPGEDVKDWTDGGYELRTILDIEGDASGMPCSRELNAG